MRLACLPALSLLAGVSMGSIVAAASRNDASRSGPTWAKCDDPQLTEGECASVAVPLDYSKLAGPSIDLALYRIRATSQRIGTLVVNPGGPGASGIDYLQSTAHYFPSGFDVIGFDPRGVGRSHPVECISDTELDQNLAGSNNPRDADELERWLADVAATAERCSSTDLGKSIGSTDVARDIDEIRKALGDEQISYLGFSYGARLGWTYATMFPDRVRAMVLDGPEDPTASIGDTSVLQAKEYEHILDQFVEFCAASAPKTCPVNPRAAVVEVVQRADAQPISTRPDLAQLSGTYALNGVITSFYDKQTWAHLGAALQAALDGNGAQLLELSFYWRDRHNQNAPTSFDAQNLIFCSDRPDRPSVADLAAIHERVAAVAPAFSEWIATGVPRCYGYPVADDPTPMPGSVAVPPILVISSTGDVATPLAGAQHLVEALGNAVLLIRDGPGHTSYLQNPCIDSYVERYLVTQAPFPSGILVKTRDSSDYFCGRHCRDDRVPGTISFGSTTRPDSLRNSRRTRSPVDRSYKSTGESPSLR